MKGTYAIIILFISSIVNFEIFNWNVKHETFVKDTYIKYKYVKGIKQNFYNKIVKRKRSRFKHKEYYINITNTEI